MIKIVGLGTGNIDSLTVRAYKEIKFFERVYVRTKEFYTVKELEKEGVSFISYDEEYNSSDLFKILYDFIAEDIINKNNEFGDVLYAVPGHPLVAEKSVINIIELCKEKGIDYEIISSTSFIDLAIEKLEIDPSDGFKIIDAFDIKDKIISKREDLFITQVYNSLIASEVKIKLLDSFDDETGIVCMKVNQNTGELILRDIKLYELDWQEDLDHTTYVYVKKDLNAKYDFKDLLDIIDKLRSKEGCPWDMVQTHDSIKRDLLEEAYEVIDAIEKKDLFGLEEELGDILLHVVFHASIGKEDGEFNIDDVISGICKKMIFRHPHVFKDIKLDTASEVLENWDVVKKEEKGFETLTDEMKAVANALPSLVKAKKIQKKAARVGFDFENVGEAMKKVIEELNEIKNVYNSDKRSRIEEEVGDLIFSAVNVGRLLSVDCEEALEKTILKFITRFSKIENLAISKGRDLEQVSLAEMDEIWEESKKFEN
ncbi:nucleoside triphosphate pyrophosphohydrolase [uncultured Clostridium sp.]|uniref:nucleoside triphosphate pyrophosphohydrolase n=1 Tax=uncultured Clostridium sp. TaxID=59620 RepID=UPI002606EB4F|nr:nucleoside triphosphate pyrophosphohydrolase [uncultured Clostridium sp.]